MAAYITQTDLEQRFTEQTVAKVFTDTVGSVNTDRLAKALETASRRADAELLAGWGADAISGLVDADESVKDAICVIAMAIGARAKSAWRDPNGQSPFASDAKEAQKYLHQLGQGQQRAAGESSAGRNDNQDPVIQRGAGPQFLFTPDRSGRGKMGGY